MCRTHSTVTVCHFCLCEPPGCRGSGIYISRPGVQWRWPKRKSGCATMTSAGKAVSHKVGATAAENPNRVLIALRVCLHVSASLRIPDTQRNRETSRITHPDSDNGASAWLLSQMASSSLTPNNIQSSISRECVAITDRHRCSCYQMSTNRLCAMRLRAYAHNPGL